MPDNNNSDAQSLDAFEPLKAGPAEIREVIEKVLTLEQERLYQRQPHLNDDVLRVIKEVIK